MLYKEGLREKRKEKDEGREGGRGRKGVREGEKR